MYGTVAYSPVDQEVDGRSLRLFCSRVCAKGIEVIPILGYFVLLFGRFVGLFFYGWYTLHSDCYSSWGDHDFGGEEPSEGFTSLAPVTILCDNDLYQTGAYSCYDFTPFCFPKRRTVAWLVVCIVNTLVVILVLAKVPGYDGYLPTLRKNARDARFWTLFLQLLLSIMWKGHVIYRVTNSSSSGYFGTLFIFEEIFTMLAVYFWNGVPAPWKNPRVPAKHWAYRLTLVVFLLEMLYLFLLSSFYAASSANSAGGNLIYTAISAADATFLYSLTKFFWNKLFYGERNLLINDNV